MLTSRVRRKGGKDLAKITTIICLESEPLQIPLPSLDLSSRRSNLSRALSLRTLMSQLDLLRGPPFGSLENSVILSILSI
jgi:hypothetical protein